ncbi:hypothetical protein DRH27_03675 [Candidatus Falkowbacteria bacterium]|nr:MAG: hypothetical protein DRH27_03675 [Candidatus Falkowbacteria bacterium]
MATNIEQRLKEMGLWERYRDIKTRQALMTPEELEKYGAFPDYSKINPPTAPAADIDTTQAPPIDSGAGDVLAAGEGAKGAAKAALQDYEKRIKELEEEMEKRQKEAQKQMKKQQNLIDKLLKRGEEAREERKPREKLLKEAKTAALEEMGLKPEDIRQIGGLIDEITEYQRQIANLEAQKQAAIDLNRQRPGRGMGMLTAEEAIIEKQYNSRIAAKAAQAGVASQKLQLLQGAYQDARNTARTIVEAALYDQRQELEDIEWSLSVHSDLYNLASKEEQQAWTREYNLKREQLEKDRAELQAKLDLMTAAAEDGVKLGWDINYIKSKSIEELTAEYAKAVEAMDRQLEEGLAVIEDTNTGKTYDLGTVAGLKKYKEDHPDVTYSDMNAWLDVNTDFDKTTREQILKEAGYVSPGEEKVEEYLNPDYIKEQFGSRLNTKKVLRAAGVASFWKTQASEYQDLIDKLMKLVNNYRTAGYNDDEIRDVILKKIESWEK